MLENYLYSSDIPTKRVVRQKLEMAVMLGKGLACFHEERIIIVITHGDLDLLLQISHTPWCRECGKLFDCVPTALSVLFSYFTWEDRYYYMVRWSTPISIIYCKQDKSFVHTGFRPRSL